MNKLLSVALASGALLFAADGYTTDAGPACNTFAAGYTEDAERYFHLDTGTGLDGQPKQMIVDLATLLDGNWRGHSSALNCVGHYTNGRPEASHYAVRARITRKFNGAIKLEAEQADKRSVKLTKLYLAPELERANSASWKNYSIEFISPTRIKFDHKYRTGNGDPRDTFFDAALRFPDRTPCVEELYRENICYNNSVNSSRLIHEIKEINLQNDQLTVDHSLFMNGLFVSHEQWSLERG